MSREKVQANTNCVALHLVGAKGIQLLIGLAKRGVDEQIRRVNLPRLVPSASKARILRDAVVACYSGQSDCFLVLMPIGSIDAEHVQQ